MTAGQYLADGIDQKLVASTVISTLKANTSYSTKFNNAAVADLGKKTSTVVVRCKPVVTLEDTPADREGLLNRTGATSTSEEVTFTADKFAKLAIDPLDVEPEIQSVELGEGIGDASSLEANTELLGVLADEGTEAFLGETFGSGTTGAEVWSALIEATTNPVAMHTGQFNGFVAASLWNRLITDVATLRGLVDPRTVAASLLGISEIIIVPDSFMPTDTHAIVAHRNAAVQAQVLTDLVTNREDADTILFYRVRFGSKVLVPAAVIVLKDGTGS